MKLDRQGRVRGQLKSEKSRDEDACSPLPLKEPPAPQDEHNGKDDVWNEGLGEAISCLAIDLRHRSVRVA